MSDELSPERKRRKLEAAIEYHGREHEQATDAVARAQHKVERAQGDLAAAEAAVAAALVEVDESAARVVSAREALDAHDADHGNTPEVGNVATVAAGAENATIVVENGE